MSAMVRVEYVLNSWKTVRQDTIQAVEDCPAGELDFKPAPELMSFREIARHILDAGSGLSGMLLDGETNLAAPDVREKMKRHFRAKIRRGQVGFPVQEHSGEAAAGVQDMPGDLAKGHELGGGLEVQLAGGAIFHRLNGVLPDGLPGVQDILDAYHSTHCIRGAATWSREGRGMMPSCSDASFSGPRRPRERRPWRGRARCAGRYGSRAWKRTCSGSRRGTRITTPSTRSAPKAAGWCCAC